jgi:hypothetical protein
MNIVNHSQGQKHKPGTLVRWNNNTIAEVQDDGRHIIVANLNKKQNKRSIARQIGGRSFNHRQHRQRTQQDKQRTRQNRQRHVQNGGNNRKKNQDKWEKEWDREIQEQKKRQKRQKK